MNIDQASIGKIFTKSGSDVFRIIDFSNKPVVIFKNLETGEQIMLAVDDQQAKQYKALIPITDI